jgi:hypothetical protein
MLTDLAGQRSDLEIDSRAIDWAIFVAPNAPD